MSKLTNDPLLMAAKGIVYFILGVLIFACAAVLLGVPFVLIMHGELLSEVNNHDLPGFTPWLIAALLIGIAGALFLMIKFFQYMMQIINSVGQGDPFVPENGDRLARMGWLMLAANIAVLPLGGLVVYIANILGEEPGTMDASVDFGGIVLILTLFILARVFRHGAAMRADLEGTV